MRINYKGGYYDGSVNYLNNPDGYGTYYWDSGDKYVGYWKNDVRQGKGTMTWATGEKYYGDYYNDKKHGKGRITWKDGGSYDGDWRDDYMTGKGTMTWADGGVYVGDFINDKRSTMGLEKKFRILSCQQPFSAVIQCHIFD